MERNYAIMFADISGSTSLYDSLGNEEADRQIGDCVEQLSFLTEKHGGRLIKTIGDEIHASFDSADDAIGAAVDMQDSISDDESNPMTIRVGVQFGPAIARDGDLFGDAVNVAARMAAVAKTRQIITIEDCFVELSQEHREMARHFDRARVKGKESELNIYQIDWEGKGRVTRLATSHELNRVSTSKLAIVLRHGNQEKLLTDQDMPSSLSIGRDDSCDLTIDTDYASRAHVDIKLSRGKFMLSDHSTNGTYVRINGQDDLFIRREELPLIGEGYISLGEAVDESNPVVIGF